MLTRRTSIGLLVCALSLGGIHAAAAEEIVWRTDYNAARQEAREKSRPLLLYFTTADCLWCRKLDATTFRDPTVVTVIKERFICLRVDGQREDLLVQALAIRNFPTLVLAAADGNLLGTYIGHQEVPRFHEILLKVLASQTDPEWMVRDYREAAQAAATSDHARALSILRGILEDGQQRPIQAQAAQLLRDVEQKTGGQVVAAPSRAVPIAPIGVEIKPVVPTNADAGRVLTSLTAKPNPQQLNRTQRSRELLEQARESYRNRDYLGCLDCCQALRTTYSDLPDNSQAEVLAGEIRKQPECLEQACAGLGERLGALYLDLADCRLREGQMRQAAEHLDRVVQLAPTSPLAERARTQLQRIRSRSAVQVETSLKVSP